MVSLGKESKPQHLNFLVSLAKSHVDKGSFITPPESRIISHLVCSLPNPSSSDLLRKCRLSVWMLSTELSTSVIDSQFLVPRQM